MNWKKLLVSPPPSSAWMLGNDRLVLGVRGRKAGLRGGVRSVGEGVFQTGPVGLQGVERSALVPLLLGLNDELGGGKRPAVALPTAWTRYQLFELQGLPKKRAEAEDVVRWRLKKMLPVPPSDLRIDLVRYPDQEDRERVLVAMILDRAATELEAAFEEAGLVPGVLVPRLFLLGEGGAGWLLVMEAGPDGLGILVHENGSPRAARFRTVVPGRGVEGTAAAELRLLGVFLRENLGVPEEAPIHVRICSDDEALRSEIEELVGEAAGFEVLEEAAPPEVPGVEAGRATRRALYALVGRAG